MSLILHDLNVCKRSESVIVHFIFGSGDDDGKPRVCQSNMIDSQIQFGLIIVKFGTEVRMDTNDFGHPLTVKFMTE